MVYIDSFGSAVTPIIFPSEVKNSINRTRFLNNFPLALRLRIRIGIASPGLFTDRNRGDFKRIEYVITE